MMRIYDSGDKVEVGETVVVPMVQVDQLETKTGTLKKPKEAFMAQSLSSISEKIVSSPRSD